MLKSSQVTWQLAEVSGPHAQPVQVVAAKDIPYILKNNRLQTLNIYLLKTTETSMLIGGPVAALPISNTGTKLPGWHVHIHGGAWRDDLLTAKSIEAYVARAFSSVDTPIHGIASINYTNSPFPNVPAWLTTTPYDPIKNNHSDPAREAVHPQHISDVLYALAFLRSYGLVDGSYILSGHSAGACLAFQVILQPPSHYGLENSLEPSRPAAVIGLNGLYDLPNLVCGLGSSHAHLVHDYETFLGIASGGDKSKWPVASPALFDTNRISGRVKEGKVPRLVMLDQSKEDQLVPMNQSESFVDRLKNVHGLQVVRGHRCVGKHAAPWEQGIMIWETIQDSLNVLNQAI